MRSTGGGFFPWSMLFIIAMMVMAGFMILRMILGKMGSNARPSNKDDSKDPDPVAVLRERYALGEIDMEEFQQRIDGLLSSENKKSK